MEVREARTSFRDALHLAKELVRRHGAVDQELMRSNLTFIRNVILQTRRQDMDKKEPRVQEASWYRSLAEELSEGGHGKQGIFEQMLDLDRTETIFSASSDWHLYKKCAA